MDDGFGSQRNAYCSLVAETNVHVNELLLMRGFDVLNGFPLDTWVSLFLEWHRDRPPPPFLVGFIWGVSKIESLTAFPATSPVTSSNFRSLRLCPGLNRRCSLSAYADKALGQRNSSRTFVLNCRQE